MDLTKIINDLERLMDEDLVLMDSSDSEMQLGDYYNAYTEEDLINSLDEMIIGDSTGCILRSKFNEKLFAELTIFFVDIDLYESSFERDDDKEVDRTENLSKQETLDLINSILKEWNVSSFEARQESDSEF